IAYPLYFVGALAWRGSTVGQWLLRIRTLREDGDALTVVDAFKRFIATNWGVGAIFLSFLIARQGWGIENLRFNNTGIVSPGDLTVQLVLLLVTLGVLVVWLTGVFVGTFHPRK